MLNTTSHRWFLSPSCLVPVGGGRRRRIRDGAGSCGSVGEICQAAKQEEEGARGSETVQIVRTVVRVRLVCVRCPHPHQSARHPRVHVPLCMGGPWTRTDDAEVASRLGAPSPANHRSPIASPSRSFVSFLFLLCLSLRLVSAPSLPPPTPPPPPDRRAFSASSPFARFIYPPVDFSLFFQPLSLSLPILLLKKLSLTLQHTAHSLDLS